MKKIHRNAFSLTELLITVAIIGILVALVLPVLRNTKEKASIPGCLANLRALGVGVNAFAMDHNGQLPIDEMEVPPGSGKRVTFWGALGNYVTPKFGEISNDPKLLKKSPYVCPGVPESDIKPYQYTYAINKQFNARLYPDKHQFSIFTLKNTHKLIFLIDSYSSHLFYWDQTMKIRDWTRAAYRHGGIPNVLYVDGHVSPFPGPLKGLNDAPEYLEHYVPRFND